MAAQQQPPKPPVWSGTFGGAGSFGGSGTFGGSSNQIAIPVSVGR